MTQQSDVSESGVLLTRLCDDLRSVYKTMSADNPSAPVAKKRTLDLLLRSGQFDIPEQVKIVNLLDLYSISKEVETGEKYTADGIPCANDSDTIDENVVPFNQNKLPDEFYDRTGAEGEKRCQVACIAHCLIKSHLPEFEEPFLKHWHDSSSPDYNPRYKELLDCINANTLMFSSAANMRETEDYLPLVSPRHKSRFHALLSVGLSCSWVKRELNDLFVNKCGVSQDLFDQYINFLSTDNLSEMERKIAEQLEEKGVLSRKEREKKARAQVERRYVAAIDKLVQFLGNFTDGSGNNLADTTESYLVSLYPQCAREAHDDSERRLGRGFPKMWSLFTDASGKYVKNSGNFLASMRQDDIIILLCVPPMVTVRHSGGVGHFISVECNVINGKKVFRLFNPLTGFRNYTHAGCVEEIQKEVERHAGIGNHLHLSLNVISPSAVELIAPLHEYVLETACGNGRVCHVCDYVGEVREAQKQQPQQPPGIKDRLKSHYDEIIGFLAAFFYILLNGLLRILPTGDKGGEKLRDTKEKEVAARQSQGAEEVPAPEEDGVNDARRDATDTDLSAVEDSAVPGASLKTDEVLAAQQSGVGVVGA